VAEVVAAALVRRVPRDAELVAVDRGSERKPELLAAKRVDARRRRETALQLDGPGDALDRQLSGSGDRSVVGDCEAVGAEGDLRVLLGVDEVRRVELAGALPDLHVDARDDDR